jgi:hypothetical protein
MGNMQAERLPIGDSPDQDVPLREQGVARLEKAVLRDLPIFAEGPIEMRRSPRAFKIVALTNCCLD